MKRTFLFFSLVIFSLSSCGENDLLSESILNTTWEVLSFSRIDCDNSNQNVLFNEAFDNCLEVGEDELLCNWTFRFLSDGSLEEKYTLDGFNSYKHTVDVDNNNNQLTICSNENANSFSAGCLIYNVDGNLMSTVVSGDGCTVELVFQKT